MKDTQCSVYIYLLELITENCHEKMLRNFLVLCLKTLLEWKVFILKWLILKMYYNPLITWRHIGKIAGWSRIWMKRVHVECMRVCQVGYWMVDAYNRDRSTDTVHSADIWRTRTHHACHSPGRTSWTHWDAACRVRSFQFLFYPEHICNTVCLQYFNTVSWIPGRASGL